MKTRLFVGIVTYALVILFVYTAFSKLFLYDVYVYDLGRSPMIGSMAVPLSILLPAAELLIAVLLLVPRTRLYGLYGSTLLMFLFTGYVATMLLTEDSLPCTCGGLIRQLTWRQHLLFNIFFTLAAGLAAFSEQRQNKRYSSTSNIRHA